jgi:signal transduction histidine kinase
MGLGLFLARAVIEAVGGTLQIDSLAGSGTEVRVVLPTDVSQQDPVTGTQAIAAAGRSSDSGRPEMVSKLA